MQKSALKILGFILLVLSILSWIILPLIPFLSWDIQTKGILATTIFVLGEAAFVGSVALLGKEYWERIKGFFRQLFKWTKTKE